MMISMVIQMMIIMMIYTDLKMILILKQLLTQRNIMMMTPILIWNLQMRSGML